MGRGVRARRREGVGQRRAQAWRARGGPATGGLGGQSTRGGAHVEHVGHDRDAGRVEVQRLVEGLRVLPRSKAGRVMLGEVCGPKGGGARARGAAAGARGVHADDPRLWRARGAEHARRSAH